MHKYNGFMDLFGRRNLEDINFQLTVKPTDKLTLLLWHHILWRQNTNDVVYNANNTVFNSNVTGGRPACGNSTSSTTYAIHPRHELLFGYSRPGPVTTRRRQVCLTATMPTSSIPSTNSTSKLVLGFEHSA
ncbi:MAG: alginate export family protein [Pirellulales bacterium]